MSTDPRLSDERRAAMRGWVLDYVARRRRMRRRIVVAGTGVLTAAALGAAAWVVVAPQAEQERTVTCYSAADLGSASADGERYSGDAVGDPGEHALSMCSALWAAGVLPVGGAAPSPGATPAPVPPLTVCVRSDQTLVVFPTGDPAFCESRQLADYSAG
ncbi:hypothetical protein [Herbiconiux liangxiaofengii]|uniref:hypothetical protein n=1 Tax=Herbiconiux liangxiaofengii TaxID=3342795 RepID=UPI0035B71A3C